MKHKLYHTYLLASLFAIVVCLSVCVGILLRQLQEYRYVENHMPEFTFYVNGEQVSGNKVSIEDYDIKVNMKDKEVYLSR